jgi:hypothetical protein
MGQAQQSGLFVIFFLIAVYEFYELFFLVRWAASWAKPNISAF